MSQGKLAHLFPSRSDSSSPCSIPPVQQSFAMGSGCAWSLCREITPLPRERLLSREALEPLPLSQAGLVLLSPL